MKTSHAFVLIVLVCGACGGTGGSSTPAPSAPTPTIPVSSACAALGQTASAATAIVNGSECSTANAPVILLNMRDGTGTQTGACSGTVIAPRAVLTAAHCLPAGTASVRAFLGTGAELVAQAFAAFPGYKEGDGTVHDVGVVLMSADIGRAPVPLLLNRDARVGENAVMAGWGKDQNGATATLRAGVATITLVTSLTLQTTFSATFSSVCQGDSGGPIMVSEGGGWAIAGVISANSTIACSFGDNFYTNLRNPDISAFVLGRVPDAIRR